MRCWPVVALWMLSTQLWAADPADPSEQMFTVQFVVLEVGPNQESLTAETKMQWQTEHLRGLETMMRQGQALIAGPLEGSGTWRGVAVLDVGTKDQAVALFADDPWIKSGHLVVRSHPWNVAKKVLLPLKGEFTDVESCLLGILERPPQAPSVSAERSQQLQAGHMQNINAMAASGDLAVAGPFVEDTPLRGVLVFRGSDRAHVESLVARDPAVSAGRLTLRLMNWAVSKGVLPPATKQ